MGIRAKQDQLSVRRTAPARMADWFASLFTTATGLDRARLMGAWENNMTMTNEMGTAAKNWRKQGEWRILLLLALGTMAVRWLMVTVIWPGDPLTRYGDGFQYYSYTMYILHDPDWFTKHIGVVPPGYPFFLAGVFKLCGDKPVNGVYAQMVLAGFTSSVIYLIGRSVFNKRINKRIVGILAACWFAIYPQAVYESAVLIRETLIILLVMLVVYALLRLRRCLGIGRVVLMSAVYTLLVHTDPRFLFYVPFIMLFLLSWCRFRRQGWKAAGAYVLTVVLLSVPWSVRNYLTYNEVLLVDTRTLGLANIGDPHRYTAHTERYNAIRAAYKAENHRTERHPELTGIDWEKHRTEIRAAKSTFPKRLQLQLRNARWNLVEFWRLYRFEDQKRPWPDLRIARAWSLSHNLASIAAFGPLLLLMPLGAYWCFRRHRAAAWILVSPLILHTLLHMLQWARCRYRLPIDPLLMLLSAFAITCIWDRIRLRPNREVTQLPKD